MIIGTSHHADHIEPYVTYREPNVHKRKIIETLYDVCWGALSFNRPQRPKGH